MKLRSLSLGAAVLSVAALLFSSCDKSGLDPGPVIAPVHTKAESMGLHTTVEPRRTLIYYCLGFNSLSDFLSRDLKDISMSECIPGEHDADNALVVFEDLMPRSTAMDPETPCVYRMFRNNRGEVVRDTLYTFPVDTPGATSETLRTVLECVKENVPSRSYGMVFSSHATGWLPGGYFNNSEVITRSVGQTEQIRGNRSTSYEIDLKDFAKAFPMKFDYILFDACLMGGVEVAYELKDVCDYIGFSQAEVAASGFNYNTVLKHLISGSKADPMSVCMDYFEQYVNDKTYGATISLVDCSKLEELASVCKRLFNDNAYGLSRLKENEVQGYYRANKKFFFDLEDMLVKADTPADQLKEFRSVMNDVILYKASTDAFMMGVDDTKGFYITNFCGLSSYMPSVGTAVLDGYYKTLAWNKATSLVK